MARTVPIARAGVYLGVREARNDLTFAAARRHDRAITGGSAMSLAPSIVKLLEMFAQLPQLDMATAPVASIRALFDNPGPPDPSIPEMRATRDLDLPLPGRTVPGRLYVPANAGARPGLILYYHGGGWMIGSLDTHNDACRLLAAESGVAVLSVGYRLAPEHRYPAAAEDCYDALVWAAAHADALGIDASRLATAGDSAGGNLAAVVALMTRDRGGPKLKHQLLIYPVTDASLATPSYEKFGGGEYLLSTIGMKRFWDDYLGGVDPADAELADILSTPSLEDVAPASVLTAAYDPLRDEGADYAKRLRAAGVAVDYADAPGMAHGFFSMTAMVPEGREWFAWAGKRLAAALG
jgi:acetyl esterase